MFVLGGRERLTLPAPYSAAVVEVDVIVSPVVAARAAGLVAAFEEATEDIPALARLYAYVAAEARPAWDLCDPRGPVPPTGDGFVRLPLPLALAIVGAWIDTFDPKAPEALTDAG